MQRKTFDLGLLYVTWPYVQLHYGGLPSIPSIVGDGGSL